jgi:hypothetical protein
MRYQRVVWKKQDTIQNTSTNTTPRHTHQCAQTDVHKPAHLVLQVLPETHALGVHARPAEEDPRAANEVGQGLVGNDALLHCSTQRHGLRLLLLTYTAAAAAAAAAALWTEEHETRLGKMNWRVPLPEIVGEYYTADQKTPHHSIFGPPGPASGATDGKLVSFHDMRMECIILACTQQQEQGHAHGHGHEHERTHLHGARV